MSQFEINPFTKKMERADKVVRGVLGTSGSYGNLFYLKDSDDTWYKTSAITEATSIGMLGILLEDTVSGNGGILLTEGTFKTTGLDKGKTYYISEASAQITSTYPNFEDYIVRVVGYAKSTTELIFMPSKDYYTITNIENPIDNVSGDTTLTLAQETILVDASSAAVEVVLPTAVGIKGKRYNIKKIDSSSNAVTVNANGTETIDGSLTKEILFQWSDMRIQSDGIGWYIL